MTTSVTQHGVWRWLILHYQRQILREAIERAFQIFARYDPQWVDELFDRHFVLTHLLPLLCEASYQDVQVTPVQVAELWARQISMSPAMRQRHAAQMKPAATRFLILVADELAKQQLNHEPVVAIKSPS